MRPLGSRTSVKQVKQQVRQGKGSSKISTIKQGQARVVKQAGLGLNTSGG